MFYGVCYLFKSKQISHFCDFCGSVNQGVEPTLIQEPCHIEELATRYPICCYCCVWVSFLPLVEMTGSRLETMPIK